MKKPNEKGRKRLTKTYKTIETDIQELGLSRVAVVSGGKMLQYYKQYKNGFYINLYINDPINTKTILR